VRHLLKAGLLECKLIRSDRHLRRKEVACVIGLDVPLERWIDALDAHGCRRHATAARIPHGSEKSPGAHGLSASSGHPRHDTQKHSTSNHESPPCAQSLALLRGNGGRRVCAFSRSRSTPAGTFSADSSGCILHNTASCNKGSNPYAAHSGGKECEHWRRL